MRRATFSSQGEQQVVEGADSRRDSGLRADPNRGQEPLRKYIDQAPLGRPLLTDRGLDINKTKNDINKLKVRLILCILT